MRTKMNRRRGVQANLYVRSVKKNYLIFKQQTELFLISCLAVAKCFCFESSPAYKGVYKTFFFIERFL